MVTILIITGIIALVGGFFWSSIEREARAYWTDKDNEDLYR